VGRRNEGKKRDGEEGEELVLGWESGVRSQKVRLTKVSGISSATRLKKLVAYGTLPSTMKSVTLRNYYGSTF
jgi:hypothetical protein